MVDREKVISAYECVITRGKSVCECGKCDYHIKDSAVFFCDNQRVLTDALALLKEQDERLRKLQKDKDKLCLEVSEWKHKFHDRQIKEHDGIIPYIDIDEAKCPVCKVKLTRQELLGEDVLFEDFFDYCPHCGKPVLWEGR